MKVIIGLGNPGSQYDKTRHNVGFVTINKLAEMLKIDVIKSKHRAIIGDRIVDGEKIMLVKPMTYMNLSGECVREIIEYYKVPLEDIIVIYDETNLPVGSIRVRESGSDGGHNGMKSIIYQLESIDFARIRIGIGEKPKEWDLADYVLSKFTEDEQEIMDKTTTDAANCVKLIMNRSVKEAMNRYNKKNTVKKESKKEEQKDEIRQEKQETLDERDN